MFASLHSDFARRIQATALLLGGFAALPVLYIINPAQSGLFAPCPFRWMTGWLCPGCGSLRAMHALLHGDFGHALALNPLMIILLPLTFFLLARHAAFVFRGDAERPLPAFAVWVLLFITLAFTVARNLPLWPAAFAA